MLKKQDVEDCFQEWICKLKKRIEIVADYKEDK